MHASASLDFIWAFAPSTMACAFLFPVSAAACISFVARSESSFSFHNSFFASCFVLVATWRKIFVFLHGAYLAPRESRSRCTARAHTLPRSMLVEHHVLFSFYCVLASIFVFIMFFLHIRFVLQLIARTFTILIMCRKYVFTFSHVAVSAHLAQRTPFPQHNLIAYA